MQEKQKVEGRLQSSNNKKGKYVLPSAIIGRRIVAEFLWTFKIRRHFDLATGYARSDFRPLLSSRPACHWNNNSSIKYRWLRVKIQKKRNGKIPIFSVDINKTWRASLWKERRTIAGQNSLSIFVLDWREPRGSNVIEAFELEKRKKMRLFSLCINKQ